MAIEVYTDKVELKVSAKRVWKAAFEDAHSVLPKASPDVVERVEYEGANFEVGSIRTVHFGKSYVEKNSAERHPGHQVFVAKEKILELDSHALSVKIDVIEGGFIGVLVKHYKGTFHIKETGPHTSVVHFTFEYEALSETHKSHVPIALKEVIPKIFLNIEDFLLAHPEY